WLDSVADIQYNHNWRAAIKNFNWFGLPEHFVPLAELGAQRNMRYLNINVSRFDVFKLDGVQMQGDARVALTQLSERLAQEHYAS
ncbi:hypothetical protein MJN69_29990, partial [Salmonella enterica subsp. enterica serovar Kentucky]|nr:hypothetical protein [Salmonella enterica subsp. enterica serovar Kentucky]